MLFITGDTHGTIDIGKVIQYFENESIKKKISKEDYLVILGDTSICWDNGKIDLEIKRILRNLPISTIFIDGNHENFSLLNEYPVISWHGGQVHEIEEGILHLMRGEIFQIDGKKIFTFGGAYSSDKMYRTENISWWSEEMPIDEEYERGRKTLKKHNYKVDIILSHTAPREIVVALGMEFIEGEEKLQDYLQWVADKTDFSGWYCGHFHEDMIIDEKYHVLMDEIICLK